MNENNLVMLIGDETKATEILTINKRITMS